MSGKEIKHVGIIFSGGPAPAANTVISALAMACRKNGVKVTGFLYGYRFLEEFSEGAPLLEGEHFVILDRDNLEELRNTSGVIIHNSRANPGSMVSSLEDLKDNNKNKKLVNIFKAFEYYKIDALVSIGGDDTLKTANLIYRIQDFVKGLRPVSIVHIPKTIDNDYYGIDWTFGFFSAAEYGARSIRNLKADSFSSGNWFVVELMGRKAGWLAYATGMMGEATRIISVEDIEEEVLDLEALATEISLLIERRKKEGKNFGVVCVAEGVADKLPDEVKTKEIDSHGNIVLTSVGIGRMLAETIAQVHERRTGEKVKVIPKQVGYETRCTPPSGYDVILGSQLGVGAYRALVEEGLSGVMVSINGGFDLQYVEFNKLIDPSTGRTRLKLIDRQSDFWRLARFLEP